MKIQSLIQTLQVTRNGRGGGAASVYWDTATAVAEGREPSTKATSIVNAMRELGRNDQDLEHDTALLAQLAVAKKHGDSLKATHDRLRQATAAQNQANERAADLERQALALRAAARAATAEATNERTLAERAAAEVTAISEKLGRRGHPKHAENLEQKQRERKAEHIEAQVRELDSDLAEMTLLAERRTRHDEPNIGAIRARDQMRERRAKLLAKIDAVRAGTNEQQEAGDTKFAMEDER